MSRKRKNKIASVFHSDILKKKLVSTTCTGERDKERKPFLPAKQNTLVNRAPAQETKFGDFLCFSSRPRCIIPAE